MLWSLKDVKCRGALERQGPWVLALLTVKACHPFDIMCILRSLMMTIGRGFLIWKHCFHNFFPASTLQKALHFPYSFTCKLFWLAFQASTAPFSSYPACPQHLPSLCRFEAALFTVHRTCILVFTPLVGWSWCPFSSLSYSIISAHSMSQAPLDWK